MDRRPHIKVGTVIGGITVVEIWNTGKRGIYTLVNCEKCDSKKVPLRIRHLYRMMKERPNDCTCGCYNVGRQSKWTSHGLTGTTQYKAWVYMKQRRLLCPEWAAAFETFNDAVGAPPSPELTVVDRPDESKPASPDNFSGWRKRVRGGFANTGEPARKLKLFGEEKTIREWAEWAYISTYKLRGFLDREEESPQPGEIELFLNRHRSIALAKQKDQGDKAA